MADVSLNDEQDFLKPKHSKWAVETRAENLNCFELSLLNMNYHILYNQVFCDNTQQITQMIFHLKIKNAACCQRFKFSSCFFRSTFFAKFLFEFLPPFFATEYFRTIFTVTESLQFWVPLTTSKHCQTVSKIVFLTKSNTIVFLKQDTSRHS